MTGAALAGAGSALTSALSALSNQSRSAGGSAGGSAQTRPAVESSIPILATVDKKKLRRLEKQVRNERLYNLLMQPEVLGLMITLGGMLVANNMPFSKKKEKNEVLQSVGVTASVLLGLGYAGVGDLTTLIIALGAGGLSGISESGGFGIPDPLAGSSGSSLLNKFFDYSPFGQLYNLLK